MSSMQYMGLIGMINVSNIPPSLEYYYHNLNISTLQFLPNFFTLIVPDSASKQSSPGNILPSPLSNHPALHGKNYLSNVGNLATFYGILLVYSGICILLSKKFEFFHRQKGSLSNLILQSASLHFTQSTLAAFVQMKYVNFY